MDPAIKKRKPDENGAAAAAAALTNEDVLKLVEPFSREQLAEIVAGAACRDAAALEAVRAVADRDLAQRKLFIRGLGWETTTETLRSLFSAFGELEEAVVIVDKNTGKSKGYGFITFRHADGALLALKEPSKKIDGRMAVTQLASAGAGGAAGSAAAAAAPAADVSLRKIYVGNVPAEMPSERLLTQFASYGEIEEGPLGFDKQTGKFRGFALFVYKTVEAAQAALIEPTKTIDGHVLVCKLAIEGKKGKPGAPGPAPPPGLPGQQMGMQSTVPNSMPSQYGGFHHQSLPSSMGGANPGMQTVGNQVPSSMSGTGSGGYGGGFGGSYGSSSQYGGSYGPSSQYGGPGSGGYGAQGMGSSMYRMPQNSVGVPSGPYSESGQYTMPSSAYQSQHHPPAGSSPASRVPGGPGAYPNMPPYY
ncbi:UBP1-associated protein 2C [Ananas comosus]|uniref:UBP1-associated protein 2C n=1 Tax=Ananas comosus TaxID=4615 RepID=A0A199VJX8_ANACO|nr:UBP1-associated protein 2C [Ananas comosus]